MRSSAVELLLLFLVAPLRRTGCPASAQTWRPSPCRAFPPAATWRCRCRSRTRAACTASARSPPGRTTARAAACGPLEGQCMTGAPAVSRFRPGRASRARSASIPSATSPRARVALLGHAGPHRRAGGGGSARKQYALLGAQPVIVRDKPAGHAMVTENAGNACPVTEPPFINDCDYDAAGELLRHLLGTLSPPSSAAGGRLIAFDQRELGGTNAISMAAEGFRLCASRMRHRDLPGACRVPRLPAGRGSGRRAFRARGRLQPLGGHEPPDRALSAGGGALLVVDVTTRAAAGIGGATPARRTRRKKAPQIRAVMAMVERLGARR